MNFDKKLREETLRLIKSTLGEAKFPLREKALEKWINRSENLPPKSAIFVFNL